MPLKIEGRTAVMMRQVGRPPFDSPLISISPSSASDEQLKMIFIETLNRMTVVTLMKTMQMAKETTIADTRNFRTCCENGYVQIYFFVIGSCKKRIMRDGIS